MKPFLAIFLCLLLLTACVSTPEESAKVTVVEPSLTAFSPTDTQPPHPSDTPLPTETRTPEPTETTTTIPPTETMQPTATVSPVPIEDPSVLRLVAPPALVTWWDSLEGKYVIYAHRAAGIQTLSDLDGKDLFIALINVGLDEVMADVFQFMASGGVTLNLVLQNNTTMYQPQFYESINRVGFMRPEVAEAIALDSDESLVRIAFVPAE